MIIILLNTIIYVKIKQNKKINGAYRNRFQPSVTNSIR